MQVVFAWDVQMYLPCEILLIFLKGCDKLKCMKYNGVLYSLFLLCK